MSLQNHLYIRQSVQKQFRNIPDKKKDLLCFHSVTSMLEKTPLHKDNYFSSH